MDLGPEALWDDPGGGGGDVSGAAAPLVGSAGVSPGVGMRGRCTGDQHLVMVKECMQFCVAVLDAVATELQKPASLLKARPWSSSARLGRGVR